MAIPRTFLDWSNPALPQAADWLIRQGRMMSHVDLSDTIVVVPGKRAGRRLLELLIERTRDHGGRFSRPTVTTVGALPELRYEPKFPFASELVQRLAWTRARRQTDCRELSRVIPQLPDDSDDARWLELGELLSKQHRELAADGLNFADVAEKGVKREAVRWSVLRKVQETYLRLLDDLGLWDLQTARLFAIEHQEFAAESSLRASASIVLLGESTHGTDEFYRSRIALAQQLIERKGFSLVCIEGDWPATFRLNRYIQHADPAAADFYAGVAADGGGGRAGVDGSALWATAAFRDSFPEWMWRNQPFVDFVEWLKERNMVASFDERAEAGSLYGLDLYALHESARAVVAYRE